MRSCARWSLALACLACGPNVEPSGSASGSSGAETTTSTTTSTTSTTAGNTTTSASTSSTNTTAADTTTTTSDGSSFIMDTFGPDVPPGGDCEPAKPAPEPPLPDGCAHAWLVDAQSNPIEGAYSGIVRCPGPTENDEIGYRTAAVACPDLIGSECLCDADCDRGSVCICANQATDPYPDNEARNRCMEADCAGPDDCGGLPCRMDLGACVGAPYPQAFRCMTEGDDCLYPSQCEKQGTALCDYDETSELFTCSPGAICE